MMIRNNLIILGLIIPIIKISAATHFSAKAPYELNIMIESLSTEMMPEKERSQLTKLIDSYNKLQSVDKTDFLILAKTEIYKEFATLHQNKVGSPSLKLSSIERGLKNLNTSSYSTFSKWFLVSLESDVAHALNGLKETKRSKDAVKRRIFRKKVSHINKLYSVVVNNSPENFNALMVTPMKRALQRTYNYLLYLERFSHNKKVNPIKGPIFTSIVTKPTKENDDLDEILAPVLSKKKDNKKALEKWSPADDMISLKQADYSAPSAMPMPTNDWEYDSEELIEYIDPNYTPPSTLPSAVDDWDEVPQVVPTQVEKIADPEDDWVIQ